MAIKITGDEFHRFYFDEKYWEEKYHEEESIYVDGELREERYEEITGSSPVVIKGGFVSDNATGKWICSLEKFFKDWQKKQSTVFLVIEVSKEREQEVRSTLKEMEVKVR